MAMKPPIVNDDSIAQFHPLFFRPPERSGDEWIIGYELSDIAIALPEQGAIAIQHLQAGASVAEAREMVHQRYDAEIDVADLLLGLSELGLVVRIDDQLMREVEGISQKWLERISPTSIMWLYSRPALLLYALIIIAGPLALVIDPGIRPQAQDLLWSNSYALDIFTLLVLAPVLLFKHELGHLLAARAKGLVAELTFGHRLFYLVAVSHIAGIWKLPRRERLLIYSAGIGTDCFTASLLILMLFAADHQLFVLVPMVKGLLELLIISEYLGVIWEFQIFLKTDIYHIMADLTDQHDLPERARVLLRLWWHRIALILSLEKAAMASEKALPGNIHEHVDALIISYTLLMVIGISGSLLWLFLYLLPAAISATGGEVLLFLQGVSTRNILAILDGATAFAFQALCLLLLLWSFLRAYRSRHAHNPKISYLAGTPDGTG